MHLENNWAIQNGINMKYFITSLTVFCLFSLQSCTNPRELTKDRNEPNAFVGSTWSTKRYGNNGNRYYCSFDEPGGRVKCTTEMILEKEYYFFKICSSNDTVLISVHNTYIGSNVDSINIMLDYATDTSDISVFPDQSWALRGRALGGSPPISFLCRIKSTSPVHARVYLLVDTDKRNENLPYKTEHDYYYERTQKGLDSIVKNIIPLKQD